MKCIIKKITAIALMTALVLPAAACGKTETLTDTYDVLDTSSEYNIGSQFLSGSQEFLGSGVAVMEDEDIITGVVDSSLAKAALLINVDENEVVYARSAFEQLYPASITKIMTAYLVLENVENLDSELTVSASAVSLEDGAARCGFKEGDKLTVRDALYGLLLKSGNDAANVLAEYVSGSESAFVELMNETAASFGASHTNFVNANGLHDENHYTTAYDLYLIFNQLIKNKTFQELTAESTYTATYENASGESVSATWQSTDLYLNDTYQLPDGVTIISGKTGTTTEAGSCLILLTHNEKNESFISVVMDADNKDNLYEEMSELLQLEVD